MPSPHTRSFRLGNRIAPPRFLTFIALFAIGWPIASPLHGVRVGGMIAFDIAATVFLLSLIPLLSANAKGMREIAKHNDANRLGLLAITGIVMVAVLVAVAAELKEGRNPQPLALAGIIGTLVLAWLFSNSIYTLHYAHLFYTESAKEAGKDSGGLSFPDTGEPDYWDFVYFAFCLGMTFQTSDVEINNGRFRKAVTAHCLAAFVFNLGIIAFTINVLGSSS
ncbi:DUF1345 domain-containing protein [Sphingomonas sp.]|uniref:DUF1345 domain-containing protein n=1 Tax=Sphingomonas sp. TaxID=28214 RepID=UPI000DB744BA|nr:DUF1345 domain-containing protein [Sphingomonas sp.]PZU11611.1 MAG: DUF1345 domain-containing protein [Sphingomonas sp.]